MRFADKNIPKLGDRRTITKFLLFPKSMATGFNTNRVETRWMETASWEEGYIQEGYDQFWIPLWWYY